MPVPTAPEHFHGDGKGSEVAIVWADRLLVDRAQASGAEHSSKLPLAVGYVEAALHDRSGMLELALHGNGPSARGAVSGQGDRLSLLSTHGGVPEVNRLLDAPASDAALANYASDSQSIDAEALRDGEFSLTGDVGGTDRAIVEIVASTNSTGDASAFELTPESRGVTPQSSGYDVPTFAFDVCVDRIVNVGKLQFSGHVYNLQTEQGFYLASGIVTHNCECVTAATATEATDDTAAADDES